MGPRRGRGRGGGDSSMRRRARAVGEASTRGLRVRDFEASRAPIGGHFLLTRRASRRAQVTWFNCVRGYGYVRPHDGSEDVFVHQSELQMDGFRSVWEVRLQPAVTREKERLGA